MIVWEIDTAIITVGKFGRITKNEYLCDVNFNDRKIYDDKRSVV